MGAKLLNALSVLLPVYNAQENLAADVSEILEVLCELARRFELCILDDGSNDDTAEVARELANRYPQVRLIRHPVRLGLSEAIQTGLDHTHGEVILVSDEDYCLDPDDLRTLWQLRDTQWQLSRQDALPEIANQAWMDKLLAWKPRASAVRRGFQIVSRQAFEQFRLRQAVDMVHRLDIGWHSPTGRTTEAPNFLSSPDRFSYPGQSQLLDDDYAAF
jgi:glycosyltransferase involved in cell wall biosynthesis